MVNLPLVLPKLLFNIIPVYLGLSTRLVAPLIAQVWAGMTIVQHARFVPSYSLQKQV